MIWPIITIITWVIAVGVAMAWGWMWWVGMV